MLSTTLASGPELALLVVVTSVTPASFVVSPGPVELIAFVSGLVESGVVESGAVETTAVESEAVELLAWELLAPVNCELVASDGVSTELDWGADPSDAVFSVGAVSDVVVSGVPVALMLAS